MKKVPAEFFWSLFLLFSNFLKLNAACFVLISRLKGNIVWAISYTCFYVLQNGGHGRIGRLAAHHVAVDPQQELDIAALEIEQIVMVKLHKPYPATKKTVHVSNFFVSLWIFFVYFCIFILLSRENDQCAIRARLEVASHLSPHQDWGISLSAFPNGTTSKLAGLFSTLPFSAERQARKL